jgi:hypothetical protein
MRSDFFEKLSKNEVKEIFEIFIYGSPFPRIRKLRYKILSIKKYLNYKINILK